MPINYANQVTYTVPENQSIGDGSPWQINPSKILQVKSNVSSYGDESLFGSFYSPILATSIKRTKPNSKFYVQVAGRVTGDYWNLTQWGDYQYSTRSETLTYFEWKRSGSYWGPPARNENHRKIYWDGELVYYQKRMYSWTQPFGTCWGWNPDQCVFPRDSHDEDKLVEGQYDTYDDYEYNVGERELGWNTSNLMRFTVRRRLKLSVALQEATNDDFGVPEMMIWASNGYSSYYGPQGTMIDTIGGPLIADRDAFAGLNDRNNEESFELSGYTQPTESQVSTGSYVYVGLGFKNSGYNDGANKGIVYMGKNCNHFNSATLRVYEVDADESTFIMRPHDAEFKLTEGAPPTNEPACGYGIPNHYWNGNEMFSRGIRCLIPNHTKSDEWVAFGEGFMTSDGGATGGSAKGAEVDEGYMAGMITQDNGVTWNELKGDFGSTPYVSRTQINTGNTQYIYATTYPNHPVVFDWATNGSTTNPVWIMVGREVWGNSLSNTNSEYDGTSGGNLTIYRTTSNDLRFWEKLDVVPRKSGSGKADSNQYLKSVCYSDGYFVFGSNKGYTIRSSNVATASANNITFDSWKNCNYNRYWPVPVYCLASDDGGSNIVAGGYHLSYSDDGGNTWKNPIQDYMDDWFVPQPHGSGKNYNTRAKVWNITYVGDTKVYVDGVAKGPGVWIACGFKRKYKGNGNPDESATTLYPLYAYSEDMINWHEIDVENDTNLPYNGWYNPDMDAPYSNNAGGYTCFPNNVRERITYCKDIKRFVTWANAGPGPSQHVDENGRIIDHHNGNETSGGYRDHGFHPGDDGWDSSKASLWISDGMSLTDWIQVSSGTPFVGGYYSGTNNAPTTATIFKDGKYRPQAPPYTGKTGTPNVFQFPADGYAHGRYMVGSTGGEVYNNGGGRISYIDISESVSTSI